MAVMGSNDNNKTATTKTITNVATDYLSAKQRGAGQGVGRRRIEVQKEGRDCPIWLGLMGGTSYLVPAPNIVLLK